MPGSAEAKRSRLDSSNPIPAKQRNMPTANIGTNRFGRKPWPLLLSMTVAAGSVAIAGDNATAENGIPAVVSSVVAPSPPIRSRAELDAYLGKAVVRDTPLDRLSVGARGRFLRNLEFGEKGLRNFKIDDLSAELTRGEIRAILDLFGMGRMADMVTPADAALVDGRGDDFASRPMSAFERRFDQFHGVSGPMPEETELQAAARIGTAFDTLLPETGDRAALQRLDDHDLRLAYRAAATANFYIASPQRVATMQTIFGVLETRGLGSQQDPLQLQRILVSARMFDEARRFADAHPDARLPSLPAFTQSRNFSAGQPTVWRMAQDGNTWVRSAIDLNPVQIIVTAGCHFAEDAARAIPQDPVLGPVFQRHARWLSPAPGRENIDEVRDWNRQHPNARMDMVHDRAEWPMFERWIMPTFYIFKDGKIVDSVSGWPPQPTREHLIAALARAGLLPAGAPSSGALSSHMSRDKPE